MRPVTDMTLEECWEYLEDHDIGRLAHRLVDEIHLVPVNYVVDNRSLLIRTGSGNKLLAAALMSDGAFEIDSFGEVAAWSVSVRGHLRLLEEGERHRLDGVPHQLWVPTGTFDLLELTPDSVTGRHFQLERRADDSIDRPVWG